MWNSIANKIATRLRSVSGIGKVSPVFQYTDENSASPEFTKLYSSATERVNYWFVECSPFGPSARLNEDDDNVYLNRYAARVNGYLSHDEQTKTITKMGDLVDAVAKVFRDGDRSFDNTVLTSQLPQPTGPNFYNFMGVNCHGVTFLLPLEVEVLRQVIDTDQAPDNLTGQVLRLDEVQRGLIEYLAPQLVAGGVIPDVSHMVIKRTLNPDGVFLYPALPRTSLPEVRVRFTRGAVGPATASAGTVSEFEMQITMTLYVRQTPGQDHAVILAQKLERMASPFLGAFQPAQLLAIPNLITYTFTPAVITPLDTLRHEWDDPTLRVSVGRVDCVLKGRTKR